MKYLALVWLVALVWAAIAGVRWHHRETRPDRVSERWLDEHAGKGHPPP